MERSRAILPPIRSRPDEKPSPPNLLSKSHATMVRKGMIIARAIVDNRSMMSLFNKYYPNLITTCTLSKLAIGPWMVGR